MTAPLRIQVLGQAGVRFSTPRGSVLVDPYLTDSVAESFGKHLTRLRPSPVRIDELGDTRFVLVTHAHLDHCDPASITAVLTQAPTARVIAPSSAREVLRGAGVDAARMVRAEEGWATLFDDVRVHAVPAAHPSPARGDDREWICMGFVLEFAGRRIYHAGDTSPSQTVVDAVRQLSPDLGFLPVNERNYYRDRADILGNMSVREAFSFAEELGLHTMVPIHWDMFAPNSVLREEIELLHRALMPKVALTFAP